MKKIIFTIAIVITSVFAKADNGYTINEVKIEQQFSASEDLTETFVTNYTNVLGLKDSKSNVLNPLQINDDMSKQKTAAIVAVIECVTGIGTFIPIHRFVLGVNTAGVKIFFAYFCTASGCGVGLLLDTIFLLIDMDGDQYEDSEKIIMWKDRKK